MPQIFILVSVRDFHRCKSNGQWASPLKVVVKCVFSSEGKCCKIFQNFKYLSNTLAIMNEIQKLTEMENTISEQVAEKVLTEIEKMEAKILEQDSIIAAAVSDNGKFLFKRT